MKNKRTLTLNHEQALKGIHGKVSHAFGPLLRIWSIMDKDKEAALQELSENNGDCPPVLAVIPLFKQSILLLGQVFNTNSYVRRRNVLQTLNDGKSKRKDVLRDQSYCLKDVNNQFLFGEHFEDESSKNVNAKQKQREKTSYVIKPMNVNIRPIYNFLVLTYYH